MRSLIFYFFYSEKKRTFYSIKSTLKDLELIHKIVKRRMTYSEKNIIDLDFEIQIREKNRINTYNKFGNLEFLEEKYRNLILKIVDTNMNSSYYESGELNNSEYHLNLIEINSFLSSLKMFYENELNELRNKITITWLWG